MTTTDLPRWVWDLLADLIVEDDNHPKLYFTSGAFEGYRQYNWCPATVLESRVPTDVRHTAEVIAKYRPTDEAEILEDPADIDVEIVKGQP